jgi:D-alanine-D-alanine ligase-like ATP-grasp enzyme
LDFMVDEAQNAWLIEVNTNPCIEETSQVLKTLLPRMLDDLFKLTLDRVFI